MSNKEILKVLYVFGAIADGGVEHIATDLVRNMDQKKVQVSAVYHNCVVPGGVESISVLHELWPHMDKAPNFITVNALSYRKWWKAYINAHNKFDIVHLHYIDSAFCYLDLFNKMGTVTIVHAHNPLAKPFTIGLLLSCMMSYPTRNLAKYFFACSTQTAHEIFGKQIATSKKCFILYNGIDSDRFKYDMDVRNKVRRRFGVQDDTIIIGHVGRLEKQKNHQFLLNVFEKFHQKHSNSILWLVGTGSMQEKLKMKIENSTCKESVFFLGKRDDVNDLYQAMDLFLFPSLYEGLGIVLIEAQMSGLPCIISDTIPKEADISSTLVTRLSLLDDIAKWVFAMEERLEGNCRRDYKNGIQSTGFDIKSVASWLQDFYFNCCN